TLLKILSRVTAPTQGRARLRGRVGSLLEVGTGFHPELTGRENIYLNGAILGMRKVEIDRKFDEIVDFSEVEKFLDTPVKFFSSGMRVRLAFSVAAHLEPEILLVDEVLAVGDVAFQKKSLGKMEEVAHQGRTVLFVSHNMAAIKSLCRTGVYIEKGEMKYFGDLDEAIDMYLGSGELQQQTHLRLEPDPNRRAQILEVSLRDPQGRSETRFPHDEPFSIQIRTAIREPLPALSFSVTVSDSQLNPILSTYDFEEDQDRLLKREAGEYVFNLQIPPIFAPDEYRLSLRAVVLHPKREFTLHNVEHVCPFEIYDNGSLRSRVNARWDGKLSTPVHWEQVRISAS
ncbi:MAG: Wzt carbohydrate-binding domain-containing protein, partial [Chloroflexota bacterium]